MPGNGRATASRQQLEVVVDADRDLAERERPDARGREFDRERQAVGCRANALDVADRLVGDGEVGSSRYPAVREQPDRRVAQCLFGWGAWRGNGQPGHGRDQLAGDAERFAAGGEHAQARAGGEQFRGELGDGVDDVLAVVEHEQHRALGERGDQAFGRLMRCVAALRWDRERGFAQPERREHRLRDVGAARERREFDEADRACLARGLDRQPGLAGAAGAGQRDETAALQQLADAAQLLVAADKTGELRRQDVFDRGGRFRLAAQHQQMRLGEFGTGIGAEFVGECAAGVVVRGERVRCCAKPA